MRARSDFLVLGSGIAGLSFALRAADHGSVVVVTKKGSAESATNYAQGGIAAVISPEDSIEAHVRDTLDAGAGLCREDVVRLVVGRGPGAIERLVELGVRFDRAEAPSGFDLGREGGHTQRRVLHAADFTGKEIERVLVDACERHPNIEVLPNHLAVDLVTTRRIERRSDGPNAVCGAYVLDAETAEVDVFEAPLVFLATGGCGKVYLYTSNPEIASGDGIAMAYRAGATVTNMEFIQFHPTCLYHPDARSFLISEAVRGEGAVLRTRDGVAFMERFDARGDLAPRDIVARAIDHELKRTGDDCVYLDCTALAPDFVTSRFPNIHATCASFGIEMTKQPVPVVPAAHYSCGGVRTNLRAETDIQDLFAAGEVACTGLHGANRLASNSLLEGVVFAEIAAERAVERLAAGVESRPPIPAWDPGDAVDPTESVLVNANWDEIRRLMWNYVGIVRTDKRLARARRRIELLQAEIQEYYWNVRITSDLVELRNLATVAELIVRSALQRRESRGLHYTPDHPDAAPEPLETHLGGP